MDFCSRKIGEGGGHMMCLVKRIQKEDLKMVHKNLTGEGGGLTL